MQDKNGFPFLTSSRQHRHHSSATPSTCFLLPLLPEYGWRARRACAAPVKITRVSPARLSPVPRRRDAHTEATAAAHRRRVPGCRNPINGPRRGQRGRLRRTLHVMGSAVRRVESRAAGLRAQQPSWRRHPLYFSFFFFPLSNFLPRSAFFEHTFLPASASFPRRSGEMITELLCTAAAVCLYVNTLDADFCYDDR